MCSTLESRVYKTKNPFEKETEYQKRLAHDLARIHSDVKIRLGAFDFFNLGTKEKKRKKDGSVPNTFPRSFKKKIKLCGRHGKTTRSDMDGSSRKYNYNRNIEKP